MVMVVVRFGARGETIRVPVRLTSAELTLHTIDTITNERKATENLKTTQTKQYDVSRGTQDGIVFSLEFLEVFFGEHFFDFLLLLLRRLQFSFRRPTESIVVQLLDLLGRDNGLRHVLQRETCSRELPAILNDG